MIYNAVDLKRFSPRGAVADLDASPACTGARGDRPCRPDRNIQPVEGPRHVSAGRGGAARFGAHPAYIVGGALYDTDGSQYSAIELRRLAATYGLADRVGFTGFIESADRAMRALDVVVHASTSPEPFGLVIAEAMACGRALVTSATGGAAELVRPGEDAVTHRAGKCR